MRLKDKIKTFAITAFTMLLSSCGFKSQNNENIEREGFGYGYVENSYFKNSMRVTVSEKGGFNNPFDRKKAFERGFDPKDDHTIDAREQIKEMLKRDGIAAEKKGLVISQVEKFNGKFFNPKYVSKHFKSDEGTIEQYDPRTIGVKEIQHNMEVIDKTYVVERTKKLRDRMTEKDTVIVSASGESMAHDNDKDVISKKVLSTYQSSGDHETIKFDYNRLNNGNSGAEI
ncbi:MAG: hypothetical protein IKN71_03790 [Alphaproteobacteria bacterium]|nr:hypothetical protein [Alphaproteobacteria bacterium]